MSRCGPAVGVNIADYSGACSSTMSPFLEVVEFDDRIADGVEVSFYARNVNNSSGICCEKSEEAASATSVQVHEAEFEPLSRSGNSCEKSEEAASATSVQVHEAEFESLSHWALVFYFPNSARWITYEAFMQDDQLVLHCSQMPPNKEVGSKLYEKIAKCKTSPKQLQEWAAEIKIENQPSDAGLTKCQEWLKLFAHVIGGEVNEYMLNHIQSLHDKAPFKEYFVDMYQACQNTVKKHIHNLLSNKRYAT